MQTITRLAIKKLIAQPQIKDTPEFWLDFAVRVLESVQMGIDTTTDAYEEVDEFLDVLPDRLLSRAKTNFDYTVGEDAYPIILKVEANEKR